MLETKAEMLRAVELRIERLLRGRPPRELKENWYARYRELKELADSLRKQEA